MNVKTGTILVLVGFGVTFAYFAGTRMSTEAINVAVGVLCGIVASVPVSLGLLIALTRHRDHAEEGPAQESSYPIPRYDPARPQAPQIIVVAPPQSQYPPGQSTYSYPYMGAAPYANSAPTYNEDVIDGRDWKIIGDDEG